MKDNLVCGLYNISDLDETCLKIKNEIYRLSKSHVYFLENRYSNDRGFEAKKYDKRDRLNTYYDILKKLKEQTLAGGEVCLDREALQLLMEKIIRIIGKNCRIDLLDYNIDNSNEDVWVMKYPFCRSYEQWEKWSKFVCGELNLEISAETEQVCNLVLEISREIITPNVLLAISAYTEARKDIKLEVSRSDEECKVDFELLLEKCPDCDLDLQLYTSLVKEHKCSYDMIETLYAEGLSLHAPNGVPELKTSIDSYDLTKISGDIDPKYLEKFGMKATINKKDLLQDYK